MQKNTEAEIDEPASVVDVDDDADASPSAVYEIGYHFLPTLSEEEVTATVSAVVELVKKNGGALVGDRFPSKIPLAYAIPKRVGGKVLRFHEAYFGWVAFETPRASVSALKPALDAHEEMLRYLIVKTDRGAVAAALSAHVIPTVRPTGDIGKPKREAEVGGEVSEAALEEALQTIEREDTKSGEQ